jgi:uncharacterized membrane protein HdeD (DUF308 family)
MDRNLSDDTGSLIEQYWWLPLVRGILALILGVALITVPGQAKSVLGQYFGMYWLGTGATTIFWGLRGARASKLWLLAGSIGVIGGTILVFNERITSSSELELNFDTFAIFAIITGLLHLAGGYRIRQKVGRGWAWGDTFLGLLQIAMGIILLSSGDTIPRAVLLSAVFWSFLGGIGMTVDALRLRRRYHQHRHNIHT